MPVMTRIDDATLAATCAAVAADIGSRFGHKVEAEPVEGYEIRGGHTLTLAIEPKLGIFDMVVTEAAVRLRVEPIADDETGLLWVHGSLNYEHVSMGRNGSNIGTWLVRDGAVVEFRKPV